MPALISRAETAEKIRRDRRTHVRVKSCDDPATFILLLAQLGIASDVCKKSASILREVIKLSPKLSPACLLPRLASVAAIQTPRRHLEVFAINFHS